jgi:hypothetical protein
MSLHLIEFYVYILTYVKGLALPLNCPVKSNVVVS